MMNARKPVIAAVAAALLAWGASSAIAASDTQAPETPSAATAPMQRGYMNPQKWQQRQAERAQALKAKLQLTDAQLPAWDALQKAMQLPTHARIDRDDMRKLTTPERIDRMRAVHEQRAAEADRRGEAIKTFYAQLTPEQQKVFDAQAMHGPRMGHDGRHGARHRGGAGQPGAAAS